MKQLKQIYVLALLVFAVFTKVNAQIPGIKLPKVLFFANAQYAKPLSDFKDSYDFGYGFEAGAGLGLGSTLIYGSAGYSNYTTKTIAGILSGGTLQQLPVKVGVRHYIFGPLYLNAAGGVIFQNLGEIKYATTTTPTQQSITNNKFIYEGGVGVKIILIDLGVSYTGFQDAYGNTQSSLFFKAGVSLKI